MTSRPSGAWPRIESRQAPRYSPTAYTGMMTLIVGCAGLRPGGTVVPKFSAAGRAASAARPPGRLVQQAEPVRLVQQAEPVRLVQQAEPVRLVQQAPMARRAGRPAAGLR